MPTIEMTEEERNAFEQRYKFIMTNLSDLDKLNNKKLKKEYTPISLKEFRGYVTSNELNRVVCVCWRNNNFRVAAKGIENILIEENNSEIILSFEYDEGNCEIAIQNENDPIDKIGNGEWAFGLYIKK